MINGFVYLDRIKSRDEFNELVELAKVDKHGVYCPTHVVKRNNEKIGWFSIGSPGVPVVFAWLSTEKVGPRESFSLINLIENHVELNGATAVAFPIPRESPFHPLMENMGYAFSGNYDYFVKKL